MKSAALVPINIISYLAEPEIKDYFTPFETNFLKLSLRDPSSGVMALV
jgi:hypothetical protein